MKIGFDFGSSCSTIGFFNSNSELNAFSYAQRPPAFPTLVVQHKNKYFFGDKQKCSREGSKIYIGFKMLLSENEKTEEVIQRGYDQLSPSDVSKMYIEAYVKDFMKASRIEWIEEMVICAPEVWFCGTQGIDARRNLMEICNEIETIKSVRLVSEPAAACAYFLNYYNQVTKKNFTGEILLIDYGGGTLDITLCRVNEEGAKSSITVLKRVGAGENEEGEIGKAGIAFMEKVVKKSIAETAQITPELDSKFYDCVYQLEHDLLTNVVEIEEVFEEALFLNEVEGDFTQINYQSNRGNEIELNISFELLRKTYNEIIRPTLENSLKEIKLYMDDHNIQYDNNENETFKIALVGGFGNFYLTKNQVDDFFNIGSRDKRSENMLNRDDTEKAVALGATLIANNIVNFIQKSPYDLGIANDEEKYWYSIRQGEEVVFNQPKYILNEENKPTVFSGSEIPKLVFNIGKDESDNQFFKPTRDFAQKMIITRAGEIGLFNIGFALNQSMMITLCIQMIDSYGEPVGEEITRELSDITTLFGKIRIHTIKN